ncbi:glycosyl transferase [Agaricicola taiwanensis]|uniref:Glycosyl transferase n=1 Tax=Agaricicola taiwanensis TaxID=591372 RepID=A0A8J2VNA3_9RHOB|nr:glycosyltransferase [Agaricicola taiwanensis]GGE34992.1 glycosyl transferase [Agaricicola taiwanensis]
MTSVLHVISGLGVGGAEGMLHQAASRLAAKGHRQHVVSLTGRGPVADLIEEAGVPVTCFDLRSIGGKLSTLPKLVKLVRAVKPEIIQGWMYHGDLGATFAHLLSGSRGSRRLSWGIRCSNMDMERNAAVIGLCARLSPRADVIVANSGVGAQTHLQRGYRPKRLEIIPNGVDTVGYCPNLQRRSEVRANLGIDPSVRLAVHVARVDPMKDHASFLAAMHSLPQVTGILIGAGTRDLDLPPNVLALGRRMDVPALLPAADIIVSSSAFGEGFSNALAEGMSCGLVPVATDVGDARMIVGDSGVVVPPSDPVALARAIDEVAGLNGYTLARRGAAARARVVTEFSIEKTVTRFEALYGSL